MPLTRWLRVLISLLSLATVISLTRDICIARSGSVEARYVGCPGIIALRLGNKTSTLGSHNSTVAGKNSGVLGPGIALKDDIMMAAAIFSTPVILHLLRTDALKEQNMVVALVVSGLYVLASLAMNVLNKKAAKAFEGTCLLVILQMLVSVVVIICMEHSNMKLDKCTDFLKWLIVPFAFSGMLGTSMFAFKNASLTTILIMKNILPILTFGCEKALFNQPASVNWKVVVSLLMTLAGTVLYGYFDISATNLGKVLILLNSLFTITDRLVQSYLLKGHADFSMSIALCMLVNNSLGIFPLFAIALVNGEISQWSHSLLSADKTTWFLVLMSGMCGASLGYVGLRTQQLFSGTSVLMLQNFNKILIISIGVGLFHEHLTPMSLLGCAVSLLGCFTYGYVRLPSEASSKG